MPPDVHPHRLLQLMAWSVLALFVAGFFAQDIGLWTAPILAAWFIGTQKPLRGVSWLFAAGLVLSGALWHSPWKLTATAWAYSLEGITLGIVPLLLYRLCRPRLTATLAAITLPAWAVAVAAISIQLAPPVAQLAFPPSLIPPATWGLSANTARLVVIYSIYTVSAVVAWFWIQSNSSGGLRRAGFLLAGLALAPTLFLLLRHTVAVSTNTLFFGLCLLTALAAAFGTVLLGRRENNAPIAEVLALLRSPRSRESMEISGDTLATANGERFPIRDGIVRFAQNRDLTGSNGKLNRLYAVMGGLYDDVQRIYLPLLGLRQREYVDAILSPLDIAPHQRVLETSIGTGINFKYLPGDIERFGLDLSSDMLEACQTNFRRWGLSAHLFQGNAEALPFADESFDTVFHVGGINFFNDRERAIREMIRVARPGSLLLIADETEKHVKSAYEKVPGGRGYFKGREKAVAPPIDLVPPDMREVHLSTLRNGRFYVLTFRKP